MLGEICKGGAMNTGKIIGVIASTLALGWIVLFLSSSGILVNSEVREWGQKDKLVCHYFTGISVIQIYYLYSPDGSWGRSICPRLYSFGQ